MRTLFWKSRILLLVVTAFVVACKNGGDPDPSASYQYLVEAKQIASLTKDQVASQVAAANPIFSGLVQFGVTTYRITYKTKNADGTEVMASGALVVPATQNAVPMVSYQHGTITSDASAPSYFSATSGMDGQLVILMGSVGYITVAPDYIGYGVSNTLPHTYESRQGLAQASLDLLRAAKEFFAGKSAWDNRLYLTGYSEGGYATMALLKKMEEEAPSEFNIRAVSCGAGAYNKTSFMKHLVNDTGTTLAAYNRLYIWVLMTYNRIYGLNRAPSYYFKEPYASQIPATVNSAADLNNVTINASLNTAFTDSFRKGLNDGTDTAFLNAIKDNDIYDWKPKSTLQLYHGDADELVPFYNSQSAYDAMKARGAANVELITMKGKTHTSGITEYATGTLILFTSVK